MRFCSAYFLMFQDSIFQSSLSSILRFVASLMSTSKLNCYWHSNFSETFGLASYLINTHLTLTASFS